MAFSGKVIAITGAARGIGFATAKYLAARGATVSLADALHEELSKAHESLSASFPESRIRHAVVNVSNRDEVEEWLAKTKDEFDKINGCLNNAGILGSEAKSISSLSDTDWNSVLDVNLRGVFNCLRVQLPLLEDHGSVVNVSSVAGLTGIAGFSPYVVSKHGIIGLTRCAAKEEASRNIRVNAVCPGAIDTRMIHEADKQTHGAFAPENVPQVFRRYGQPEEVAALIAYLLGDESKFTTGSIYTIDGGWTA